MSRYGGEAGGEQRTERGGGKDVGYRGTAASRAVLLPGGNNMTALLREVLFSSRGFWRRSSFPGVLLALALGVGANGATLTLAAALLLAAPEHVRSPERIVRAPSIRSWAEFADVSRRARTIDLAALTRSELGLGRGAEAAPARVECVTRGYFRLLGVRPARGRTFAGTADGGRAEASVVLSHGLWTGRFGGDPAVVGRTVLLGARGHVVVGVAPRGFRGLGPAAVDAWMLLTASPDLCSFTGEDLLDDRTAAWLRTIGRPRDGFTLRDAQAEMATLTSGASGGAGASGAGRARGLVPAFGATRAGTRDGQVVLWLAAAGGLMLLAACLNVAVLLSIQVLDRAGAFAVRRQLGATRARVFAQFLLEHLAAAAVCGAAAAGVGMAVGGLLAGLLPIAGGEEFRGASFFARVGALTLLAGVFGGLGPAAYLLRASRPSRRQDAAFAAPSGGGMRSLLVTAQFALALVLVVGAGLFVSTVRHVDRTPGLDVDRVIVATVDLARNGYGAGRVRSVFDEFLQRLERVPEAASASVSLAPLLSSGGSFAAYPLRAASGEAPREVPLFNAVSRGYFRTVGTRILRGRGFVADDAGGRPVLVLNEGLAGELWGAADPLGRCVVIGGLPCVEVVGVSENRRPVTVTGGHDEVFVPASQASSYVLAPRGRRLRSAGRLRRGARRGRGLRRPGPVRAVARTRDRHSDGARRAPRERRRRRVAPGPGRGGRGPRRRRGRLRRGVPSHGQSAGRGDGRRPRVVRGRRAGRLLRGRGRGRAAGRPGGAPGPGGRRAPVVRLSRPARAAAGSCAVLPGRIP